MRKTYLQTKATPKIATKQEKYKPNIQQKVSRSYVFNIFILLQTFFQTMSSARKEAKVKIEKSFISSFQGQNDPKDILIANNEKVKKIC